MNPTSQRWSKHLGPWLAMALVLTAAAFQLRGQGLVVVCLRAAVSVGE